MNEANKDHICTIARLSRIGAETMKVHTKREIATLQKAHSEMMAHLAAGERYDVMARKWIKAGDQTQVEKLQK